MYLDPTKLPEIPTPIQNLNPCSLEVFLFIEIGVFLLRIEEGYFRLHINTFLE